MIINPLKNQTTRICITIKFDDYVEVITVYYTVAYFLNIITRDLRSITGKGVRRLFFDCGQMENLETHTLKMKNLLTYFIIITHVILQKMHFMSILNPLHHTFLIYFLGLTIYILSILEQLWMQFSCLNYPPLNALNNSL